ncbi:hypothetical protein P3T76_002547 [Phytophthora citrophthora]|uniref:Uncharacterized protein n=1 Tax=Phytophthora citrophthora TaxID=4793 RepID=A0AAD9GVT9_9STRA|nr:hypothetical protein P3T76_002547 [Phytophthora citrophthora]
MEGVLLVEMSSGALHYTKSFSDRFDIHHPKSERLNLGALIFALQNFAGSSIQGKCHNDGSLAETRLETNRSVEIAMYATPLENMVLTATPSNKLLVLMDYTWFDAPYTMYGNKVLFTTPELDAEVAKWIVRHLAFKYESCDSTDLELTTVLNQVPRRFRLAFSQCVDDAVERELIHFSETLLIPLVDEFEACPSKPDGEEFFLFFYFSSCLDDSTPKDSNGLTVGREATSASYREEKCGNAVRSANPTVSDILQHSAKTFSIRNVVAVARAIITSCESTKKKRKRFWWRSRNTIVNHSEPHEFRRVIEVRTHERKAELMEPHRAVSAHGIAEVLFPFVELSSNWTTSSNNTEDNSKSQKLSQITWKNIPSMSLANGKRQGTNIIVWRSGPCCIFYPTTASCADPDSKVGERHAVSALFSVLEPLLKAKAIV